MKFTSLSTVAGLALAAMLAFSACGKSGSTESSTTDSTANTAANAAPVMKETIDEAYARWVDAKVQSGDFVLQATCESGKALDGSTYLPKDPGFKRADLNGDKVEDAVAAAKWTACGGMGQGALDYAWTYVVYLSQPDGKYLLLEDPKPMVEGIGVGAIERVADGMIYATGRQLTDDDEHCCPSQEWDATFKVENGQVVLGTKSAVRQVKYDL